MESELLELYRKTKEDSVKYEVLVSYLKAILNSETTYDLKEKISQILRCLGELK